MSLILDALRKLDREKASRRQGPAHIATEILRPDPTRSPRRTPLYLTVVALTAVVTAALTYTAVKSYLAPKPFPPAVLNPTAKNQEPLPAPQPSPTPGAAGNAQPPPPIQTERPPMPKPDPQAKPSPPPVAPPPVPSQSVAPVAVPPEPAQAARHETSRVPSVTEPPAENRPAPASPPEKEAAGKTTPEKPTVPSASSEKPVERIPAARAPDPSNLRLSAIVWHEEPSRRIAVINGMITTEQSLIEGATVLEITPNRVRLSHNGRPFELLLK